MNDNQRPTLHVKRKVYPNQPKSTDVSKDPNNINNVQDKFLKEAVFNKQDYCVSLACDPSVMLIGLITKFDKYTVIVNVQGAETLVYKAYIVGIVKV